MDGGAWWAAVHGVATSQTRLSDFTFTFHFHTLEKEMETHSGVLAWRILWTGKPGGLLSIGSHRAGHDWSDLAVAAAAAKDSCKKNLTWKMGQMGKSCNSEQACRSINKGFSTWKVVLRIWSLIYHLHWEKKKRKFPPSQGIRFFFLRKSFLIIK